MTDKQYPTLGEQFSNATGTTRRLLASILTNQEIFTSKEDKKKMVQPEDCAKTIIFLTQLPSRVCINEITISPTWNRDYISRLTDQIPS